MFQNCLKCLKFIKSTFQIFYNGFRVYAGSQYKYVPLILNTKFRTEENKRFRNYIMNSKSEMDFELDQLRQNQFFLQDNNNNHWNMHAEMYMHNQVMHATKCICLLHLHADTHAQTKTYAKTHAYTS